MKKLSLCSAVVVTLASTFAGTSNADPSPTAPYGPKCHFHSNTDVTVEAGWQNGVIYAGVVAPTEGRLVCTIIVNSNTHNSTSVRAQKSFPSIAGVVVGADTLNYQATAADDVSLCSKWVSSSGTLYWVPAAEPSQIPPSIPPSTNPGDYFGHWSTNPGDSCGTATSIELNDPECSIWHAIDRRLGTNIAEIWQDCEPYGEFPLPI